jgi:hypothetical protein
MEKNTDTYNKLMEKLRKATPVLQDADLLTDSIMQQIKNSESRLESHFLLWVRTVSASAAVFLLGLFVFQQTKATNVLISNEQTAFLETSLRIDSLDLSLNDQADMVEAYKGYMQEHSEKNDQLRKYFKH